MTQETKVRTILIADDEPDILEILHFNLSAEGYRVKSATNGNQALELAKLHKPDLIILDVMIPEIDGITVCENIRLFNTEIPILILSAKNNSSDRVIGLQKGADD